MILRRGGQAKGEQGCAGEGREGSMSQNGLLE